MGEAHVQIPAQEIVGIGIGSAEETIEYHCWRLVEDVVYSDCEYGATKGGLQLI